MTSLRSPIRWMGGKFGLRKQIVALLPAHRIYVEPFGGGASVLLEKEPAPVEVYNDLDSSLVNFWRVLQDKALFAEFCRLVGLMPYSREEYYRLLKGMPEGRVEAAAAWFYIARTSFSGKFGSSWSYGRTKSQVSAYLSAIELLPVVHERLQTVHLEHDEALKVIQRWDTPETVFYCDPPYVLSTRKDKTVYAHEMSDSEHEELVKVMLGLQGRAVVSGYDNAIYQPLDKAGWGRHEFNVPCHSVGTTRSSKISGAGALEAHRRVEVVWVSP